MAYVHAGTSAGPKTGGEVEVRNIEWDGTSLGAVCKGPIGGTNVSKLAVF